MLNDSGIDFLSENPYFTTFNGVKNSVFDDKNINSDQKYFKKSFGNQYKEKLNL